MSESNDDALAYQVASLCLNKYGQLPPKGAKPAIRSDRKFEWSILAGVVVELHNDFNCISLATGVKALAYDSISLQGDLVHDSHAEVLARRGARTWLLARLVGEVKAPSDYTEVDGISRLFEPVSKGRWRCKAEAKLHLYCSTFPCGDASSSLLMSRVGNQGQHCPSALAFRCDTFAIRGRTFSSGRHLRLRTKPGKLQSMPSISMSCTDKIAMWSAVGMQGALLSKWLEPIFFDTLVIGTDSIKTLSNDSKWKELEECRLVLQSKTKSSHVEIKPLKVMIADSSFCHAKETVQEKLLLSRPSATLINTCDELDLVPAAGSIVWILGEKAEHLNQGKRQGAALPRKKSDALAPSTRSRVSKASYFLLAQQATASLGDETRSSTISSTYYEAKHDWNDPGISRYQQRKHLLRGSMDVVEQTRLVERFLIDAKDGISAEQPTTSSSASSSTSTLPRAPFHGWLVSGKTFETFHTHGVD